MATTPLTNITNPPRCPLEDPIATVPSEVEDPAAKVGSPISKLLRGGEGASNRDIRDMLGGIQKRYPGKEKEVGARVTLPWLRWFNFLDVKVTEQGRSVISSGDVWSYDFSSEDFWSNVSGPGAGSWDVIDSEANHPGIQRLRTDVNNGDITTAFVPVAAASGIVRWDQLQETEFIFKTPPTITLCRFELGLSSDARSNWPATAFEFGSDMIYLLYDTAVDNALRFKLRVGGAVVAAATTVIVDPCPADTWVEVNFNRRLVETDIALDVIVNGSLKTTILTGLPSDSTTYGGTFKIGTHTNAARDLPVDRAFFPPKAPTQRWDVAL